MTTIAALVTPDGQAFVAGDRWAVENGNRIWVRATPKVEQRSGGVHHTAAGERTRFGAAGRPITASFAYGFAGPNTLGHFLAHEWESERATLAPRPVRDDPQA